MDVVQAQRTLMKSAPELWEQVSDRETLARRLAGFGDIRITRTEQQRRVTWEGEGASGEVTLEPAGWGTRVTLTARRQRTALLPPISRAQHRASAESPPAADVGATVESPAVSSPASWSQAESPGIALAPSASATTLESPAIVEAPTLDPPRARPRGLLSRLLRREVPATRETSAGQDSVSTAEPEPRSAPEPLPPPAQASTAADIPAPASAEDAIDRERLAAMLDQLGANHHRPFSRG
jgi:hypothetical protein